MVIVDTHIFIWDLLDPTRLSRKANEALSYHEAENDLYICDISFWEIGLLVGKQKIHINKPVHAFIMDGLEYRDYKILNISPESASIISSMSNEINSDPADRIIAAITISSKCSLITADKNLRSLKDFKTIW